jgi:hypothetical protein
LPVFCSGANPFLRGGRITEMKKASSNLRGL